MRRKDKEVVEAGEVEAILRKATVVRLGLCAEDRPYVVPMSFGYRDRCLYLHAASEGKKIDLIRANDRVCFQADVDVEVVKGDDACGWGMRFASVMGTGRATLVEDPGEKRRGLDAIMAHYDPGRAHAYPEAMLGITTVIRVEIEEMTGKRSGFDAPEEAS